MRVSLLIAACLLAGLAAPASACSVPVFRYALERWASDAHPLVVGATPTPAQQAVLARLSERSAKGLVNIEVIKEGDATEAALYYPGSKLAWWRGAIDEAALANALDSPWRQEIAKRLVGGDSAVWVLLESGDAEQDQKAADLLDKRLKHLATVLELPKQDPKDLEDLPPWKRSGYGPPLRLAFSMLRLSRGNPAEAGLVAQLLGSDQALAEVKAPMAFAVFGRGRFLEALHGKDLSNAVIDEVSLFLTGACSCQVKELNPGTDLQLTFDWEDALIKATPPAKDETAPAAGDAPATAAPPAVAAPVAAPEAPAVTAPESKPTGVETLVTAPTAPASRAPGEERITKSQTWGLPMPMLVGLGLVLLAGLAVFLVLHRKP